MDIDSCFRIELHLVTTTGERRQTVVPASEFFEFEEFDEAEWDCELPLRQLDCEDYVTVDRSQIYELTTDIFDLRLNRHRKFYEQRLLSSRLIVSWDDVRSDPSSFEIILDIALEGESRCQIARVQVNHGQTALTSHSLCEGDSLQSLGPSAEESP
jgi:hypothetical protein